MACLIERLHQRSKGVKNSEIHGRIAITVRKKKVYERMERLREGR
jgi:hypothetical protein